MHDFSEMGPGSKFTIFDIVKSGKTVACLPLGSKLDNFRTTKFVIFFPRQVMNYRKR